MTDLEPRVMELLAQGHTQAEVARMVGVSRQRIFQLRQGDEYRAQEAARMRRQRAKKRAASR